MKYVLAALFVIGTLSTGRADTSPRASSRGWWPLEEGTSWTFDYSGAQYVYSVTGKKRIGDVECGIVETSIQGRAYSTEYIGRKGGAYAIYGVSHNGRETIYDTPMPLVRLGGEKGQSWAWKGTFWNQDFDGAFQDEGEEKLEIEGKEVACRKVSCKVVYARNQEYTWTQWYAPKMGWVRIEYDYGAGGGKLEMILKEFKKGKK